MSATTIQCVVIRLACGDCGEGIDVPVGFVRTVRKFDGYRTVEVNAPTVMHTCAPAAPESQPGEGS